MRSISNEIIFDSCAGSEVIAWVAKENNRNFICCELDKDTYNISKEFLLKKGIIV